ncbi:unnamed protein product [Amoebophrya sp. A25]|nr:unnamed protein product [Amoebophrya sp. A25]|eukprot:GSA25T00008521001.1
MLASSSRSASPSLSRKFSMRSDTASMLLEELAPASSAPSTPPMEKPRHARGEEGLSLEVMKLEDGGPGGEARKKISREKALARIAKTQSRSAAKQNNNNDGKKKSSTRSRSIGGIKANILRRSIGDPNVISQKERHREATREAHRGYHKHMKLS